jgi:hypothetical protein
LQGGWLPSWQMTVVPECGGTTTVVWDFGGGGLLLLIHADKNGSTHSASHNDFMADPSFGFKWHCHARRRARHASVARGHLFRHPAMNIA